MLIEYIGSWENADSVKVRNAIIGVILFIRFGSDTPKLASAFSGTVDKIPEGWMEKR